MSGDPLDLDGITDDAERAQRFIRDVRLDPATALALVAEVRRLRANARSRFCGCAWCCSGVTPGKAGAAHLRTCIAQKAT